MNNETKYNIAVKLMQKEKWLEAAKLLVDILDENHSFNMVMLGMILHVAMKMQEIIMV